MNSCGFLRGLRQFAESRGCMAATKGLCIYGGGGGHVEWVESDLKSEIVSPTN